MKNTIHCSKLNHRQLSNQKSHTTMKLIDISGLKPKKLSNVKSSMVIPKVFLPKKNKAKVLLINQLLSEKVNKLKISEIHYLKIVDNSTFFKNDNMKASILYEKYQQKYESLMNQALGLQSKGQSQKNILAFMAEKKNGLTQMPNARRNSNLSEAQSNTAIRSAVMLRRMEYNSKLQRKKAINVDKVVMIQRKWRKYYLREIMIRIRLIQRVFRKTRRNIKAYKLIKHLRSLHLSIIKKCFNSIAKFTKDIPLPQPIYSISNKEIDLFVKSNEKNLEDELKFIYQINEPTTKKSLLLGGMKSFPRPMQERKEKKRRHKEIEDDDNKDDDTSPSNNKASHKRTKSILEILMDEMAMKNINSNLPKSKLIKKKVLFNEWCFITYHSSFISLSKVLLIQQSYRTHLSLKGFLKKNHSIISIFWKLLLMTIKNRTILLYGKHFFTALLITKISINKNYKKKISRSSFSSLDISEENNSESPINLIASIKTTLLSIHAKQNTAAKPRNSFTPSKKKNYLIESSFDAM